MTRWRRAGVRVARSLCGGGALPEASLSAWLPQGGPSADRGGRALGAQVPSPGLCGLVPLPGNPARQPEGVGGGAHAPGLADPKMGHE